MATLVLGAVGGAIAGPIGRAVGSVLGLQVDQALFAPKSRQGPRLGDLSVQTSSYGSQIPKLFGRNRVSGTVIWSTELIETSTHVSGGKGRPGSDTYSYSASFAVALSARRIVEVARIWADGKLIRGAAGDLKVETELRIHPGDPDQALDPLIASAEGIDATPAYRDFAYAVFEGMQLGDFGNRIPSLSFEIVADEGVVSTGAVLAELCDDAIVAEDGPMLTGVAARGASVRELAETISAAIPVMLGEDDGTLIVRFAPHGLTTIPTEALGATAADGAPRIDVERQPLEVIPAALAIAYTDPDRDYQPGLQRARREGAGAREDRVDLPVTIAAGAARSIAEHALAERAAGRTTASVTLPWRALTLVPGTVVRIEGADWRVREIAFERMVVRLGLSRFSGDIDGPLAAAPGRSTGDADLPHGPTTLRLIDLPSLTDAPETAPRLVVMAAGMSSGWRRAALLASIDGGTSFEPIGSTARPATLGQTTTLLPSASENLIDRANSVDVTLLNTAMTLAGADGSALLQGVNRAMIGDELIQFGRADPIGAGQYRLSQLWRARRGTAVAEHAAGAAFSLLDPAAMVAVPADKAVAGVIVMAAGLGDGEPYPQASCALPGRAVTPLPPVHATVDFLADGDGDGDVEVAWVRRSRGGWPWPDAIDTPVGEEREAYRLSRTAAGGDATIELDEARWRYTAAARAADFTAGLTSITVQIAQIGTERLSPSVIVTIPTH